MTKHKILTIVRYPIVTVPLTSLLIVMLAGVLALAVHACYSQLYPNPCSGGGHGFGGECFPGPPCTMLQSSKCQDWSVSPTPCGNSCKILADQTGEACSSGSITVTRTTNTATASCGPTQFKPCEGLCTDWATVVETNVEFSNNTLTTYGCIN